MLGNGLKHIFSITDFGAAADGKTNCTRAIEETVEAASKAGGGTVYVPAGTYITGPIYLRSNITLNLDAGAVLLFSNDISDYKVVNSRWEGVEREVYASCIYGDGLENIAITGRGTLDGQGAFWWKLFREKKNEYPRPKLISIQYSSNVLIEGVKLTNSPSWTINPICCENVTVDKVTVINPSDSPNTDGIDPDSCKNVHISNCHIDVGDDCIAIKSGTEDTEKRVSCENITIINCTMVHGHGGVVLGSEMSGSIRNVTISNCVFEGTDRGIRMKSRRGRGGVIEDVRVNNIVMKEVICPFTLNLYYFCGPRGNEKYVWDKKPYPVTDETPAFRRIHFSNITAREVSAAAGFLYGLAEMYAEDITFNNVDIAMAKDAEPGMPDMLSNLEPMKLRGFYCGNVQNVCFNEVKISGHEGPSYEIENGSGIEFIRCKSNNELLRDDMLMFKNVVNWSK